MTEDIRVALSHVGKTFNGHRALQDVTLNIRAGEIHALVGENGSGKSTLIKVLSGFHQPDQGSEITVGGEPLPLGNPPASVRAGLRFVYQDLALVDEMSASDNIGLASGYASSGPRVSWAEQRARSRELLARMGVSLDVDAEVGSLSSVERSAVAIARSLDDRSGDLQLLVLDEPTAALPPADVDSLFAVLRQLRAQGISILYVSHRLGEVLGLADRVTALRDGRCLGTFDTSTLDTASLAELIVGRAVHELTLEGRGGRISADAPEALRVQNLRGNTLGGIDFALRRGEILGFAGIDGSGREELASAITGASAAEMTITVPGKEPQPSLTLRHARDLGIALVLPNSRAAAAAREMTVRENISLADLDQVSSGGWISNTADTATARRWIDRLSIAPGDPDQLYGSLSGGNRQKVCMARGLLGEPSVLVLDDPTSGVDIGARRTIYDLVHTLSADGMSTVVCSADLEDLVGLADRVLVLVDGVVVRELAGDGITESNMLAALAARPTTAPA